MTGIKASVPLQPRSETKFVRVSPSSIIIHPSVVITATLFELSSEVVCASGIFFPCVDRLAEPSPPTKIADERARVFFRVAFPTCT